MRCIYLLVTLALLFPAVANALPHRVEEKPDLAYMGSYIQAQVVACFKKRDLDVLVNIKTANSTRAKRLFGYPFRCSVQEVKIYLLQLERKFKDADGDYFWIVGVGSEPDGPVQFYIVLTAKEIKWAP